MIIETEMTPLEETLRGLIITYQRGPRTAKRRDELMKVVEVVLDYFIPRVV